MTCPDRRRAHAGGGRRAPSRCSSASRFARRSCSGILGLLLALLFFALQAPDVALSEIVVGSVALPAMLFLAIAKVREQESRSGTRRGASRSEDRGRADRRWPGVGPGGGRSGLGRHRTFRASALTTALRPDLARTHAVPPRAATNSVVVTAFDYRGFDTLGEEFILFISVVGVMVLLRAMRGDVEDERPEDGARGRRSGRAATPAAGSARRWSGR